MLGERTSPQRPSSHYSVIDKTENPGQDSRRASRNCKCRRRTKDSVWWSGLGKQLEEMVTNCRKCIEHRTPNNEPMILSVVPERPWQVLGTDLFSLNGRTYLLVMDYYSRFNEISILLASQKSIRALKSIFAISDNGPKLVSTEFDEFSKEYSFTHVTSSQKLRQVNGEAERAVQTIKKTQKKEKDPVKALVSYRATSLEDGYSPAEKLFERKIRSTVPVFPGQLKPSWPGLQELREHEQGSKIVHTKRYNVSH